MFIHLYFIKKKKTLTQKNEKKNKVEVEHLFFVGAKNGLLKHILVF